MNNEGERITVTGIPWKISIRQISTIQMKKSIRKGCKFFVVHIINNEQIDKKYKLVFEDIPILQNFEKSWLVLLATRTKRKVVNYVESCNLMMNQFETQIKLNVLPLGSYDVLIGMDWLDKHQVILYFFQKNFTCLNNEGKIITVTRIPRKIFVRQITTLQMKKAVRKGCKVFSVHIINN